MKSFMLLVVLASVLAVNAVDKCVDTSAEPVNSQFHTHKIDKDGISNLINLQFRTSYKYLLMSMNFNSFLKDRPGFSKLFRQQSDKLFDDSIALVKQLTTRGYQFEPKAEDVVNVFKKNLIVTVSEQTALQKGVENTKALLSKALDICRLSDFAMKHYVEEEILEDYTKTLRQFSGYYNNLNNFGPNDYKLGVYLFDQQLQK